MSTLLEPSTVAAPFSRHLCKCTRGCRNCCNICGKWAQFRTRRATDCAYITYINTIVCHDMLIWRENCDTAVTWWIVRDTEACVTPALTRNSTSLIAIIIRPTLTFNIVRQFLYKDRSFDTFEVKLNKLYKTLYGELAARCEPCP